MNEYITDLIQYTIDFESIDDSIHYKCHVAEFRAGLGVTWGIEAGQ
jgi:hypothetical protein